MVTLDQIRDRLSSYKEYDKYLATNCVWHDDEHPSLMIYKSGYCHCLGCNHTSDFEGLYSRLSGEVATIYRESTEWTPPRIKTEDPEFFAIQCNQVLSKHLQTLGWYLRMRGVDDRIETAMLGWYKGWYTIPVFGMEHKDGYRAYKGLVMRAGQHIQEAEGHRFYVPFKQPAMMYVPDWNLIEMAGYMVIVFGMFDALVLSSLRIPACTTTAGQLSFDPSWLEWFRHKIYVIPDQGEDQAAWSLASKLGWRGSVVNLNYPEGMKDPADFAKAKKKSELLKQLTRLK